MPRNDSNRREVLLDLGDRSYSVKIGPGLLDALGPAAAEVEGARAVVVVADQTVADLYGEPAEASLRSAGLATSLLTFPAGEANKTLTTISALFDGLFAVRPAVDRDTLIVALGGGVTGDVAGFLAASALRGLRWLQCPTTLLADVDSSVGGKTGVDHAAGKNLIGAFHQPRGVVVDVETLKTLPDEEVGNGLAECVKHGVIRDAGLLDFIENSADALLVCEPAVMTEFVAANVKIKAAVVADDETESGRRAHLNYGHTVGHAIETLVGYQTIAHGQAVSLGMVAEGRLAVARRLLPAGEAQRVETLLSRLGLPTTWPNLDPGAVWQTMQHDKKARAGKVRMVLAKALGTVDVFDDIQEPEVRAAVQSLIP